MLPLWIIDLREKTERRTHFEELLGKLAYVKMPNDRPDTGGAALVETVAGEATVAAYSSEMGVNSRSRQQTGTVKESIEAEYRENAERESIITGFYWKYSPMAEKYRDILRQQVMPVANEEGPEGEAAGDSEAILSAQRLYSFQSELVSEGQRFIRQIRESNARPHVKINIVVLGDVTEELSRLVFPSVAALIQKEKGRILASHIHQGVEIIGMLYIPSNINTLKVGDRKSMRRTLAEIDMQRNATTIRGYDHVMLYQDVQNRTECHYGALGDRGVAEYLFQCMVNLYFASDETHPVISGTSSADSFYFSMGASSVYFDTEREDRRARYNLAMNLIRSLKSEGEGERKAGDELRLLNDEEYNPQSFFTSEALEELKIDDIDEAPTLHPIKNYLAKHLKRAYYNTYLRVFTKRMHSRIVSTIDQNTKRSLESIAAESKRRYNDAPKHLLDGIRNVISKLSADDGGIPAIIRLLKEMKEKISIRKNEVAGAMDLNFWNRIIYHESGYIPKDMEDTFIEYHDVYTGDIRAKSGGTGQLEMKKQTINELNGLLSKEATMLSRICRSVLLGIMLALAVVPVLNLISPQLLNVGRVGRYAEWWAFGLFFVPTIIQLISWWLYTRRKKKAVRSLQAIYLHDAYARVANRIESEITGFYNKLIALADRYEKRCESIMKNVEEGFEKGMESEPLIPPTMFNQPLIGGKFGGQPLLPLTEAEDSWVNINFIRYKLSEVGKREHFLFINNNSNLITDLFGGISLCENLLRRVTPEGKEELVSKDQQEKEQEEHYLSLRTTFQNELKELVALAIQPRENATVGEKAASYCTRQEGNAHLLRPMIDYSAANGELISSADTEFLDVKMNVAAMEDTILPYVAIHNRKFQTDRFFPLYQKYLFLTRWRSFDHFSFNRILPMEDFDEKVRKKLVSEWQEAETAGNEEAVKGTDYASALLLWALCGEDISQDWHRLFPEEKQAEAFADKETYREILNQED